MEKLIYPIWKRPDHTVEQFRTALLTETAPALLGTGVHQLRINIVDDAVAPADPLRQVNNPPPIDAMISAWVDTVVERSRQEAVIDRFVSHFHCHLVTESEPIVSTRKVGSGERVPGMCQVVFLRKPQRLSYSEWIEIWHNSHTQIAIDIQSTFGYRQNVIVRSMPDAKPRYDAIVEENFPAEAMTSPHVFFDADGDEETLMANIATMIESSQRFIDFDEIDVIPTSEYNWWQP